jgi:probable HAF family extracellular repeat protein
LFAAAIALPMAVQAAPRYPYKPIALLPFSPGQGAGVATLINNHRLICGLGGPTGGFCFQAGKVIELKPLPGDSSAAPAGINEKGQVVGSSRDSNGNSHAVIFVSGVAKELQLGSHLQSEANGINNAGSIVGSFSDRIGESVAYLYKHGVVRDLGTLGGPARNASAQDINERFQIVGSASSPQTPTPFGEQQAFLWEKGVMKPLETPAGHTSIAAKVNDHGQAVGFTHVVNTGSETFRAALWDKRALKILVDQPSSATGINNLGQVVGAVQTRAGAFLYDPGKGLQNLNDLIDPAKGWTIVSAQGINDRSEIVGFGCKNELCGPVLLIPVVKGCGCGEHHVETGREEDAMSGSED